jgi:sec-independent protein translocase protein TatA
MENKLIILLGMPGMPELIIIGVVLLLMFGGKKIPELMKGLGQGISEFKKAKNEVDKEIKPE